MIYLSIIIPVYNEEKRLKNLTAIIQYLKIKKFKSELIIVNDGSRDKTKVLLKKLSIDYPLSIISYKQNKGKGYAIKTGMLAAKGKYQLFTDIDLSTPIEIADILLSKMKDYPIVIGTRKHPKSTIIIHQPKLREFMGKVYTTLANKILGLNVTDITCGFKSFSKKASKEIFSKITSDRWGFDAETLMIAKKLQYKILELPIQWSNERDTKVKLPQDAFYSFAELIKIFIKGTTNKYNRLK